MNFSKPILVDWQKSGGAAFIRRHRWFFSFGPTLFSPFHMIFVYVPSAVLLLTLREENALVSGAAFIGVLVYTFVAFIYIEAALEK
jgi:hypothetical protein